MNREMEEVFQTHLNTMHQQLSDLTAVSVNLLRNGHSYVNHSLCYENTILRLQQRLNKQLKRYFDEFGKQLNALIKYYEMIEEDEAWLCSYKLKQAGIDLDKWEAEKNENR